jgi:hypothetical protein
MCNIRRLSYIISSVGHPRSDSIGLLVLSKVVYNGLGTALYYRSLGTSTNLLRRSNILGRPYIRVMTYKAVVFTALKYLGNCRHEYIAIYLTKPYFQWSINGDNPSFLMFAKNYTFISA